MNETQIRENKRQHILDHLKVIIHEARELMIMPEYQSKTPDHEVLGLLISQYLEWDGRRISQAFLEALDDANFHSLVAKLDEIITEEMDR